MRRASAADLKTFMKLEVLMICSFWHVLYSSLCLKRIITLHTCRRIHHTALTVGLLKPCVSQRLPASGSSVQQNSGSFHNSVCAQPQSGASAELHVIHTHRCGSGGLTHIFEFSLGFDQSLEAGGGGTRSQRSFFKLCCRWISFRAEI